MTNKKIYKCLTIINIILLLFFVIWGTGCGGGSSAPINEKEPAPINNDDDDPSNSIPQPDSDSEISPDPIVNPEPTPTPTPDSESELEFGLATYSVVFDSDGGTEIDEQTVVEEGNAIRPNDPEKDGYVFLSWRDDEGYIYDFEAPVYSNVFLTAEWGKLEKLTNEEAELFNKAYIGGKTFISFDNSPVTSVDVQYTLDGIGTVEISEVTNNPMCNTAGLIGSPIEITAIGANVENAEIAFHYDPSKLAVDPNDLSIAWYDSSNDLVVLLSNDTVIDTENNVAKVLVNHFSMYGLVLKTEWLKTLNSTIKNRNVHNSIVLILDFSVGYSTNIENTTTIIESSKKIIDCLDIGDRIDILLMRNDFKSILLIREYLYWHSKEITSDSDKIFISNELDSLYSQTPSRHCNYDEDRYYLEQLISEASSQLSSDFNYFKRYNPDRELQLLIIFLTSGSDSYDDNAGFWSNPSFQLQKLIDEKKKFIPVILENNYTNSSLEQNYLHDLADQTEGIYIQASNSNDLKEKISQFSSVDTDKDGIIDDLEKEGMRDQYGKVWSTDFTLVDTDGDGLSDDVEMGKYFDTFMPYYFKRFSNPNKTTKIENGSSCTLPSKVNTAIKHRGEKMLYLTVNLKSFGYKDLGEYEAFFQPVKKLEFDITDLPVGFKLKTKNIESSDKQRYIGGYNGHDVYIDKDYTLTAGITYEDERVELNSVNLKLTIDDMVTYNELSIDRTKTYVNSKSLEKAKLAAASVTGAFIGELQNEARNVIESNAHDDSAANRLKKQMTAYNTGLTKDGSTPPDEVYTAFARAVLRAIEDCNINDYSYQIDKGGVDLILQVIKQLMGNRTQNYTFNINGIEYNVTFDIHTMSTTGAYTGFGSANVYWYDKSLKEHKWLLTWTTNQRQNYEALANYCSVLNKLQDSTVKQFFVTYINTAFKLLEIDKKVKIKVEHLEKAERIIKALCGDKEAGKELSEEVLGKLDDKYHELLKNFVKKNIPGGKEFLTAAEKLNKAREKREEFQSKITEYVTLSESEKTASNQFSLTEKAYSELKSAYDSLSGIDIFEGFFVPSTNWPSWF